MTTKNQQEIQIPECGYTLNTIYFYLTEGCNLKCRHCWIAPKFQSEDAEWPSLDFELFKDIVRQGKALGMRSVKLTGGEPLIHPDIDKILDYICEQDLQVTVETNGLKCTPEIAEKIAKGKNPFVSISLDGSEAAEHEWVRGVEGCFEAALEGVRNLVKVGIRPQLIMSVMKRNAHQLESIVRLAEKENVESVKYNLVTPTARGEQMHEQGETLSIEELVKLGEWVENTLQPSTKIRLQYSHPNAFKPLSKMFSRPQGKCGIFGIIGVLGSGKYALCGIGETVQKLVFGHAGTDKLADIWNNNKILHDIREGLPKKLNGICGDCLLKEECLGSCIAMNYYTHHDLFAPYWYCAEAAKAGIFPKTRIRPGSQYEKVI
ncbi:MAG: SynChlorMet cassette radical SAM/SPASM protein ScmF [Victivallaceae bacterium]|nr:SynChlorMet cassette radical SAM/SPASM protein ScmF [Victivallaceae bacterium]